MKHAIIATLFVCACAAPPSDGLGETAGLEADTAELSHVAMPAGAYQLAANRQRADDLVTVNLLPATKTGELRWVWQRCYDTPCSQPIAQDGTYALYKSRSGTRYIKFFTTHVDSTPAAPPSPKSPKSGPPPGATPPSPPDFVDVYAYTRRGHTLRLRRANTSRVFTMTALSDADACDQSGGTMGPSACDCNAVASNAMFEPGLGGCFTPPVASEAMCDATAGAYTDDDNNLVGSYCECGAGRYFADGAGCADVP